MPAQFLRCGLFLAGVTVRCAAYAAWTTPGLVKTDKTCVKLTCLYQVRVFPQEYTQVVYKKYTYVVFDKMFVLS